MGDWGLKVSQQGYDVKTCADKEMLLHSSFKHLKIYMEGSFSGVAAGGTIATHNLGYKPIFYVHGLSGYNSKIIPGADEDFIHYDSPRTNTTTLIQGPGDVRPAGYYYIFQEQVNQSYSAVEIQPTATSQGTQIADYGMKASKATYDVKTAVVKNLIMTSGRKSANEQAKLHIIHSITTGSFPSEAPWTITVTHSLGYIPMVWWFHTVSGDTTKWQMARLFDSVIGTSLYEITTTNTTFSDANLFAGGGNYSCVIFKDPAF